MQILSKYQADIRHAEQVAKLSKELFGFFSPVHNLAGSNLESLILSAYLHDIGHFINKKKHHLHSRYVILHDRLLDYLGKDEREFIGLIVLNHRKTKELGLKGLSFTRYQHIKSLIALLRIADVLDYEHEQKTQIKNFSINRDHRIANMMIEGMDLILYEKKLKKKLKWAVETWGVKIRMSNNLEQQIVID